MAGENQSIAQPFFEGSNTPIVIPASKLDADQYSADDLDGVTESLFGSGNMAYASLQASQTDAALSANNAFNITGTENFAFSSSNNAPTGFAFSITADDQSSQNSGANAAGQFNIPGTSGSNSDASASDNSGGGNFASSTVGSLSASQLSSDAGSFAPAGSGLNISDTLRGSSGQNGASGRNGSSGRTPDIPEIPTPTDGKDGTNGQDGNSGDGHTLIEINLGDTVQLVDNLFTDLGDTIITLTSSITEITNSLDNILNTLDIHNLIDLTQVTNLATNLTENLTENLSTTLTEITNITENVTNLLGNVLGSGGLDGLNLKLDLNALDTVKTGLNVPLDDTLATDLNLSADLSPAVTLANNIADLTGLDVLSDSLAELGGVAESLQGTLDQITSLVDDLDLQDPGATISQLTDTITNLDDTLLGLTASVDDALGGVLESVGIGDGGGIITDTLDGLGLDDLDDLPGSGEEIISSTLEQISDLGGILGGGEEGDDGLTDTLDALTNPLTDGILEQNNDNDGGLDSNVTADIPLDPIEEITGDINLDIDADADLLGNLADPLVNDGEGGTGEDTLLNDIGGETEDLVSALGLLGEGSEEPVSDPSGEEESTWTESIITSDGLFDDVVSGLDSGGGDALPDPVGTVSEGLGALDVEPEAVVSGLGGLFG